MVDPKLLSYAERALLAAHPLSRKLFTVMAEKKSNLIVSADVTTTEALLSLADRVGPNICMLKTHVDILDDFSPTTIKGLVNLAKRHNFLLFEDRKFADIGNTVKQQFAAGIFKIAEWADCINAHLMPGPGIVKGLQAGCCHASQGLLLLAEMSSVGQLANADYILEAQAWAARYSDFVVGFIAQHGLAKDPGQFTLMPGISLTATEDALGQNYMNPFEALVARGVDGVIVGRAIVQAEDPGVESNLYKKESWKAYEQRLEQSGTDENREWKKVKLPHKNNC